MAERVVKLTGFEYDRSNYLYYVKKDDDGEVYVYRAEMGRGRKGKK